MYLNCELYYYCILTVLDPKYNRCLELRSAPFRCCSSPPPQRGHRLLLYQYNKRQAKNDMRLIQHDTILIQYWYIDPIFNRICRARGRTTALHTVSIQRWWGRQATPGGRWHPRLYQYVSTLYHSRIRILHFDTTWIEYIKNTTSYNKRQQDTI